MDILWIAGISLGLTIVLSILIGTLLYKRKIQRNKTVNDERAQLIVREAELQAENIKKDRILEAKEKLLKMKQEFEEEANRKKKSDHRQRAKNQAARGPVIQGT